MLNVQGYHVLGYEDFLARTLVAITCSELELLYYNECWMPYMYVYLQDSVLWCPSFTIVSCACQSNLAMLVRYILLIVASLVFMFILSWKLTLVLLAVVPVVSIGAVVYGMLAVNLPLHYSN